MSTKLLSNLTFSYYLIYSDSFVPPSKSTFVLLFIICLSSINISQKIAFELLITKINSLSKEQKEEQT